MQSVKNLFHHSEDASKTPPAAPPAPPVIHKEYMVHIDKEPNQPVGVTFEDVPCLLTNKSVITFDAVQPTSELAHRVSVGDRVLEVNGIKVQDAKQAAKLIREAAKLSLLLTEAVPDPNAELSTAAMKEPSTEEEKGEHHWKPTQGWKP